MATGWLLHHQWKHPRQLLIMKGQGQSSKPAGNRLRAHIRSAASSQGVSTGLGIPPSRRERAMGGRSG